ncbi:PREDICTED: zinc finger protein 503-like [Ficedula albicollis]|uniref:zinc finger protein 503-like n=1 Tax=Ficedula albicollis TaxID=59894 RepID=UPI00035996D3|nr:PREDICTED: zinc finger protein 503-like [Ficedula albicollis]
MRRWVFPSQLRSPREGGREAPGEAAHLRGRAGPGGGLAPRRTGPTGNNGRLRGVAGTAAKGREQSRGGPCSRNASSSRLARVQPPSCERLEQSGGGGEEGGGGGGGGGREPAKRSGLELMMKAARPCADRLLSIPRSHGHTDTHRARPRCDPGGYPAGRGLRWGRRRSEGTGREAAMGGKALRWNLFKNVTQETSVSQLDNS